MQNVGTDWVAAAALGVAVGKADRMDPNVKHDMTLSTLQAALQAPYSEMRFHRR